MSDAPRCAHMCVTTLWLLLVLQALKHKERRG